MRLRGLGGLPARFFIALARLVLLRKIRAVLALAGKKRRSVFYAPQKLASQLLWSSFLIKQPRWSAKGKKAFFLRKRSSNFFVKRLARL